MPRTKIYGARLNLNVSTDIVAMMERVQAKRAKGLDAVPAQIYREALELGLGQMLDGGSPDQLDQLDQLADVLERLREHARPVGRLLARLDDGVDVLERLAKLARAVDILERLAAADGGIDVLERLAEMAVMSACEPSSRCNQ